ncbi:hypothetical protein TNCV_1918031, partial [Trichonephila clavipes]
MNSTNRVHRNEEELNSPKASLLVSVIRKGLSGVQGGQVRIVIRVLMDQRLQAAVSEGVDNLEDGREAFTNSISVFSIVMSSREV